MTLVTLMTLKYSLILKVGWHPTHMTKQPLYGRGEENALEAPKVVNLAYRLSTGCRVRAVSITSTITYSALSRLPVLALGR